LATSGGQHRNRGNFCLTGDCLSVAHDNGSAVTTDSTPQARSSAANRIGRRRCRWRSRRRPRKAAVTCMRQCPSGNADLGSHWDHTVCAMPNDRRICAPLACPTDWRQPAETSCRNVLGVKRRFRWTSTYEANSEAPVYVLYRHHTNWPVAIQSPRLRSLTQTFPSRTVKP